MPKHLLVIDDETEIRELLRDALTLSGFRVTAVGTTAEALQLLQAEAPDLVITDLQLVDSDGFTTIEQVKARHPRLPVILLTGVLMNPEDIPAELSKLIACYLPKTASLEQIVREVRKWTA